MNIQQIYKLAIEIGIQSDFRPRTQIEKMLQRNKEKYAKLSPEEKAEKAHINVVIAGHISSDSIGMNLFLDELEKKGIEIIPCSGLIRVSRAR